MPHLLSKSKYIRGLQCERALWLDIHCPQLAHYPAATLARFRQGRDFERRVKDSFTGGIDISSRLRNRIEQYPLLTARLLSQPGEVTLFEAGFLYDGVLVLADVLHKAADGCVTVYEVKDSMAVSDTFRHDVAIQHYVIAHALPLVVTPDLFNPTPSLQHFYLLHHDAEGNPIQEELTQQAQAQWETIAQRVAHFKQVAQSQEPLLAPSDHCHHPYACPYIKHCQTSLA